MACRVSAPERRGRRAAIMTRAWVGWALALAACSSTAQPSGPSPQTLAQQREEYDADVPKTILELQPWRTKTRSVIRRSDGTEAVATLTNLNPFSGAWYLLTLSWSGSASRQNYHLESATRRGLLLDGDPGSVRITDLHGFSCDVAGATHGALDEAVASGLPYAPLCGAALYVRNPVAGHHTSLESITDFLRDHVWGGEQVINFVKEDLYHDAFLEQGVTAKAGNAAPELPAPLAPLAASLTAEAAADTVVPEHLAIDLIAPSKQLTPGNWYGVRDLPGVTVSVIAPQNITSRILLGHESSVNPLGAVESRALVYLVAFDLQEFDLHFALGTDHPRLDWSERPPPSSRDPRLPGPDGVASAAPLVTNGMVSPADVDHTVATFAGGFKRSHGAFRSGPLAERNHGSHYGFVEQGVIFSKLQPGLATVFVTDDGTTDLRTWSPADDAHLAHVRYARQNGLPLIEYEPASGRGIPGSAVNLWGPGNWSGSENEDLRTLRAGLCLQENGQHRFLIYGYFSDATPSAMARVFQAYHCRYAMHLDMNALEHTYLALYVHRAQQRLVEHLIEGMAVVDRTAGDRLAPRFLAFPDDRDFFYLTRRESLP